MSNYPVDYTEAQIKSILHMPGVWVYNPKATTEKARIFGIADGEETGTVTPEIDAEPVVSTNGEIAMASSGFKGTISVPIHNFDKNNLANFGLGSVLEVSGLSDTDLTAGKIEYSSRSYVSTGFQIAFFPIYQKGDGTYSDLADNDLIMYFDNAIVENLAEIALSKNEHTKQTYEFRIGAPYKLESEGRNFIIGDNIVFDGTPLRLKVETPAV